jgi:phosphoserine phosphatase RsbU/P
MSAARGHFQDFWRRLSRLDLVALLIFVVGTVASVTTFTGGAINFIKYLAILAGIYLFVRMVAWGRNRLLWSLRNRLIVAYLFIAVVPILLIMTFVVLAGNFLYSQLGAYLLYEDLHQRIELITDMSQHIAAAHGFQPRGVSQEESERVLEAQSKTVHDHELPGLTIKFSNNVSELQNLLKIANAPGRGYYSGLLQQGGGLSMVSMRVLSDTDNRRMVFLSVPMTPELLATVAPDLGAIQLNMTEPYNGGQPTGVIYTTDSVRYQTEKPIVAKDRTLQPAGFWLEPSVNVVSRLENAASIGANGTVGTPNPVFAVFSARPTRLNGRMFSTLGELRDSYRLLFLVFAVVFLLIWMAAFVTGVVLTRQITKAIADLYHATQYVQGGDLTHRVRIERRDQLGVLAESFNLMTGSISGLIEEQKKRQRLENEILIAREVQSQLFPHSMPKVPGVDIQAICKAARSVSGDYYDFIQLSPTHVAIALADISGKGISAALLMASLQAALRSQLLTEGSEMTSTAELVARLNRHLVRNTGDDRFATFFIAVYDSATRTLRYTNAGHLPSFLISRDGAVHLSEGGMVLGVVEDCCYNEEMVHVPENAILVAYSDGLVEPENVYGEEFGIKRLQQAAVYVQASPPKVVAESLMTAAEEWAGTPEQADDMTVIVARMN